MIDVIEYVNRGVALCEDMTNWVTNLNDIDIPDDSCFSVEYVKVVYDIYMKMRIATEKIPTLSDLHGETLGWAEEMIMEICSEENQDNPEFKHNEDEYYSDYVEWFYNTTECYQWCGTLIKVLNFLGLTYINDYDYDYDESDGSEPVYENTAQRKVFKDDELVGRKCWI